METFLTCSINNFNNTNITLKFIDSYKHLTYPLDGLVKCLLNKGADVNSIKNKISIFVSIFS